MIRQSNEKTGNCGVKERIYQQLIETAKFFRDYAGKPYALIKSEDGEKLIAISSKDFKRWLRQFYYDNEHSIPNNSALQDILEMIEAYSYIKGDTQQINNRVAMFDNKIWYHLGGNKVVCIDETMPHITNSAPVLFSAGGNSLYQEEPNFLGDFKQILNYINITDRQEQLLFMVAVLSCFVPGIPHPIIILHGTQGSAKSTTSSLLKKLIDPSADNNYSISNKQYDFGLQLSKNYLVVYDNLSYLNSRQSDTLCKAVTGGSESKRENYTDTDMVTVNYQNCVIINGINIVAEKPDLLERALIFNLHRITEAKRRTESELWTSFQQDLPFILGGALKSLSLAMGLYHMTSLDGKPRMADFAKWGCAMAIALGYSQAEFMAAYNNNLLKGNNIATNNNPVGIAIMQLMKNIPVWTGTMAELLSELKSIAVQQGFINDYLMPKAANKLNYSINSLKYSLQLQGISISQPRKTDKGITLVITKHNAFDELAGGQQKN